METLTPELLKQQCHAGACRGLAATPSLHPQAEPQAQQRKLGVGEIKVGEAERQIRPVDRPLIHGPIHHGIENELGWFVGANCERIAARGTDIYLHADGVWRQWCNDDGWYKTLAAARAALDAWNASQQQQPEARIGGGLTNVHDPKPDANLQPLRPAEPAKEGEGKGDRKVVRTLKLPSVPGLKIEIYEGGAGSMINDGEPLNLTIDGLHAAGFRDFDPATGSFIAPPAEPSVEPSVAGAPVEGAAAKIVAKWKHPNASSKGVLLEMSDGSLRWEFPAFEGDRPHKQLWVYLERGYTRVEPSAQPLPAEPVQQSGVELIAAERARQVSGEGWTAEHDAAHKKGELVTAAEMYLREGSRITRFRTPPLMSEGCPIGWPWDGQWWKPSPDPIRNLVKAGSLIAAEIDRLQRRKPAAPQPTESPAPLHPISEQTSSVVSPVGEDAGVIAMLIGTIEDCNGILESITGEDRDQAVAQMIDNRRAVATARHHGNRLPARAAEKTLVENKVGLADDRKTKDAVAAVMLLHGTSEQQEEACDYAGIPKPSDITPAPTQPTAEKQEPPEPVAEKGENETAVTHNLLSDEKLEQIRHWVNVASSHDWKVEASEVCDNQIKPLLNHIAALIDRSNAELAATMAEKHRRDVEEAVKAVRSEYAAKVTV